MSASRLPTRACAWWRTPTAIRGSGRQAPSGGAPRGATAIERKRLAGELLADVRRLDREIATARARVTDAVTASGTALLEVHGIGPIVAGFILGHVGDPTRFTTPDRFAAYNGTAPIEASSGPKKRHRLNPRGNRTLNHALHLAAVTQVAHPTPGRAYYDRKLAEGKSKKEALRALNAASATPSGVNSKPTSRHR